MLKYDLHRALAALHAPENSRQSDHGAVHPLLLSLKRHPLSLQPHAVLFNRSSAPQVSAACLALTLCAPASITAATEATMTLRCATRTSTAAPPTGCVSTEHVFLHTLHHGFNGSHRHVARTIRHVMAISFVVRS